MLFQRARKHARAAQIEYLEGLYESPDAERNFGVDFHEPLRANRSLATAAPHILAAAKGVDAVLWPALFQVWPSWRWGLQGTGDCVSWGTAHLGDVNLALQFLAGKIRQPDALIAQESIYGFGKTELANSYGRHRAGMAGQDAVEAWKQFGTLYRKPYEVGGEVIDLREYSGNRAVSWGENPASTRGVPDDLEPFAAEHKAVDVIHVDSIETGAALLEAGYAWQYCGRSYWPTARTPEGYGSRFTSGAHCMTCVGVHRQGEKSGGESPTPATAITSVVRPKCQSVAFGRLMFTRSVADGCRTTWSNRSFVRVTATALRLSKAGRFSICPATVFRPTFSDKGKSCSRNGSSSEAWHFG